MNQNYYFSAPTRRGYYPRPPSYGNHGYGYGNPPAIIVNYDSDSDDSDSCSDDSE